MTTPSSRALCAADIRAFGAELDALRRQTLASVGKTEADYIYRVRDFVRYTELAGRGALVLGWLPPFWLAGVGLLVLSKIVENMELGHNVMHGQYDWMNDPTLRGDRYEWDHACAGAAWRHSHNYLHHTYTNIVGRDRDVGYGALRLTGEQPWHLHHLAQPLIAAILALNFQWGIAGYDLELEKVLSGEKSLARLRAELKPFARKIARQAGKDFVFFPVLAGVSFLPVLSGTIAANLIRDVWTFAIIFCGHFTADAQMYDDRTATETRGDWYLRQLHGSSNLDGGLVFHFLTGNLSHQIEHHLFPDVPAVRYAGLAVQVRELCARYGQHYNTGSFTRQFAGVLGRIFRYALPIPSRTIGGAPTRAPAGITLH